MTAIVLRGDARDLPMEDASVDLLVCSPPYFSLRSYLDNGVHYDGQIGSEATPREYIRALLECTREWMRVLKPEGSLFVNLGDKYSQYEGTREGHGRSLACYFRASRVEPLAMPVSAPGKRGVASKSLMGLPWRYAIGCMDELGLILRSEIVWQKVNSMPESVRDRVRRSHEQVFHFTRQQRYYSAIDEIREPHQPQSSDRARRRYLAGDSFSPSAPNTLNPEAFCNPLGRLPGSVWAIPGAPLRVPAHLGIDHFAAYPPELARRIILGWSPREVCTACGQGRWPVARVEREHGWVRGTAGGRHRSGDGHPGERAGQVVTGRQSASIIGYACACTPFTDHPGTGKRYGGIVHSGGAQGQNKGQVAYHVGDHADGGPAVRTGPWREYHLDGWIPPPSRPGVVADPFGGTGTTAMTASVLGRTGITIDKSADYCRLARWRVNDPGERARALGLPKPPPVPEGQLSLSDLEEP